MFLGEEAELAVSKGYQIVDTRKIGIVDLNKLLREQFADGKLDFMSLDVEGQGFDILQSIDFDFIRPTVICIESVEFMGGKEDIKEYVQFMKEKDYCLHADTWINSIFVDKKILGVEGNDLFDVFDRR